MKDSKITIDLQEVIKNSVSSSIPTRKKIDEALVAEPKVFKQVSEFVSQKTKDNHIDLYKRYAESFTRVSSELDAVDRSNVNSSHCDYRSLKLDETYNLNATWLHELYFANCFDPQSEIHMDTMAYMRLQRDFGTFDDWQSDFMACAMSCGQGWAVCVYNLFLRKYVNTTISNHSQDVMVGLYPIIVVDCWEHSFLRDYLGDKKSYLVAMMRELNWEVIEERFKKAESICEVTK